MSTIQVRNVPEHVSRELKARAASEGRSLSDFLLLELEAIAARPTRAEVARRIAARGSVEIGDIVSVLAEGRREGAA